MRSRGVPSACLLAVTAVVFGSGTALAGAADFHEPQTVEIRGYVGHTMEPFLSRDGVWLFFNTRNQPGDETDIHVARRIDDLRFAYLGPLRGANSAALDGVPSMDRQGRFYFVSPRDYETTRNTLWRGYFQAGEVSGVEPLPGDVQRRRPPWINIDAEISADGRTLYAVENRWRLLGGGVETADLILARRDADGSFRRVRGEPDPFGEINTDDLEFAPATTADELTLYFTRVARAALARGADAGFGLYVATRPSTTVPFGPPQRIAAVTGYVEGPTVSSNGCAIYFHKRLPAGFRIQRAAQMDCPDR